MDSESPVPAGLRVAFVAGVSPGKWFRRWEERFPETPLASEMVDDGAQLAAVREGRADLAFIRLPADREGLHVIPLYEEVPVVVAPKGHEIQAFDEVPFAEIEDELFEYDGGASERLDLVEGGAGLAILPMSVVRHFNRKELRYRPVTGVPGYEVGVAWLRDNESETVQEFIGIVRGRSASSSRQASVQRDQQEAAKQRRSDRASSQSAEAKARNEASRAAKAARSGKPARGTGKPAGQGKPGAAGGRSRHSGAGRRRPR
ncbi:LysR family substrate-binding domain-containing protein [Sinomonas sp. ASV322]|uniref:LysR family substrate-binding domain-containing protein n=1 Tax=Sinomonas sp. ASV322 TaxID=3041920 RepID=UPI0027DC2684|nr:LysR family substrate-binding domain-containing protein [Sinomonas sp. ASV322]MDQ4501510.1 LysR family substrate-binding domain-containing protein [Sinomonas sp. ASV322]